MNPETPPVNFKKEQYQLNITQVEKDFTVDKVRLEVTCPTCKEHHLGTYDLNNMGNNDHAEQKYESPCGHFAIKFKGVNDYTIIENILP